LATASSKPRHGPMGPLSANGTRGMASATNASRHRPGLIARMARKLRRADWRARYRLRKQTVEPSFGQIKHGRGFRV